MKDKGVSSCDLRASGDHRAEYTSILQAGAREQPGWGVLHGFLLLLGCAIQLFGSGHGVGTPLLVMGMATTRLGQLSSFSSGILLLIMIQLVLVGLMIAARFVRLRDRATMLGFVAFLTVLLYGLVIAINEGPFLIPVVSGVPLLGAAWVALKRMRACGELVR